MLVYRITLSKYAAKLKASGRSARWNPNKVEMIYTSGSRALACLENVVHRGKVGLTQPFSVMTIEINDQLKIEEIKLNDLPANWRDFTQMAVTQKLGEDWIKANTYAVLQVPSSIIDDEVNYLLNLLHPDFNKIKLLKIDSFIFDNRIKL